MSRHQSTQRTKSPEFITSKEVEERWRISRATLRRWRKSNRINAHHMGRGVRFDMADILRFEASTADQPSK